MAGVDANTLREMAASPAAFRRRLLIDTNDGPKPFAGELDDWQRESFPHLDNALRRVAGYPVRDDEVRQRFYFELPRGSGKTLSIAAACIYLLAFARRQLAIVAAAADRDQAKLIRDAIDKIIRLNPWLAEALDTGAFKVSSRRNGSVMECLAHDLGSSWGLTPDVVVCDELAAWPSRELFDSLLSAAAKRSNSVAIIASNAGWVDTDAFAIREAIRVDPAWVFRSIDRTAKWISEGHLAEQRRILPAATFARLFENVWASGLGDAFDPHDLAQAFTLPGPTAYDPRLEYLIGVDIGLKHDHTGAVVVGCDAIRQRLRLAHVRTWIPTPDRPVALSDVRRGLSRLALQYRIRGVAFDPWQAALLSEDLGRLGLRMMPVQFVPRNLALMATAMTTLIRDRRLDLFDEGGLRRDLDRMRIQETVAGLRLVAPRSRGGGHADTATALAMTAFIGRQWLHEIPQARRPGIRPFGT